MDSNDIKLLMEQMERLQKQNQEHKADIEMTVNYIARLLTDMGLLTADFQFQFSMKTLSRTLLPIITNPAKAEQKFGYLADLRGIIEKYGKQLNKIS
jgi:hypothetical protein